MFKKTVKPATCEMWSVICYLNARNTKPGWHSSSTLWGVRRTCHEWFNGMEMGETLGHENMHDDPRSGRPSVVNEDLVHAVEEKIQENRWFTILSLSLYFPQISRSLLHEIVSGKLRFWKLCSRLVLKMLTKEYKIKRQASALTFLTRYSEQGDDFLSRTVRGGETWVSRITPESKQQSMEWRHTSSPRKKKFKQTISTRKIMCTVFWGWKHVLLVEFLPQASRINTCAYCCHAIQNKRCGMLSQGVLMLRDNARPHTAATTQDLIAAFGWEQLD
jgi:hypothetical protein